MEDKTDFPGYVDRKGYPMRDRFATTNTQRKGAPQKGRPDPLALAEKDYFSS